MQRIKLTAMHIIKTRQLNRRQQRGIAALTADANAYDGTKYGAPEDADVYYLAYLPQGKKHVLAGYAAFYRMGDSKDQRIVYEVSAAVHPDMRRTGVFSRLIAAAGPKVSDSCIRYAVYENAAAKAVLSSRKAVYDHAELMLGCNTAGFDRVDEEVQTDHGTGHAYTKCGECWFRLDESRESAYVFGVLTYENCQRKGCAYRLLSSLFAQLKETGISRAMLQVSSENLPAIRLYDKLGMQELERLDYYYEYF